MSAKITTKECIEIGFKKCKACKCILPIEMFSIKSNGTIYYICTPCRRLKEDWRKKFNYYITSYQLSIRKKKECSKCGETKTLNEYRISRKRRTIRPLADRAQTKSVCKGCENKRLRETGYRRTDEYRKRHNKNMRKGRKEGKNWYIRQLLRRDSAINVRDIPQELVDLYREQLRLKRLLDKQTKGVPL